MAPVTQDPHTAPEAGSTGSRGPRAETTAWAVARFASGFGAGLVVWPLLGWWLDQRRGGGVAWTLAGVALGLANAAWQVALLIRASQQDHPRNSQ